jgi:protein-S-isoprenylcysteine O-methyltransferase Ste14
MRLALRAIWTFIGTLAVYLGLSLVAWGGGDLAGYFAAGARLAYAFVIVLFAAAIAYQAVVAPEGIQGAPGLKEKRVPRQTTVGYMMLAVLAVGLILLPICDRRGLAPLPGWPIVRWSGVVLTAAGYALVFLSGIFLGRQYSAEVTIQENHKLITAGPYRRVRHPRYLGVLLITLGASLVFRTWAGLVLFPIVLALILWRIWDEEALMEREFGDAWRAYCRGSGRLGPRIDLFFHTFVP